MIDDVAGERTALKEWAVLVDAMERGDIIAMVRKGGIREQRAGFSVRHERFVMYPTYFHEKAHELAPMFRDELASAERLRPVDGGIRIAQVANVIGVWTVTDLERLRAIEGEHGLAWGAVESRFNYRDRPVVEVVAVQISTLPSPVVVPELRRYQGCVSWVELEASINVSDAVPVLSVDVLEERLARIKRALGELLIHRLDR